MLWEWMNEKVPHGCAISGMLAVAYCIALGATGFVVGLPMKSSDLWYSVQGELG